MILERCNTTHIAHAQGWHAHVENNTQKCTKAGTQADTTCDGQALGRMPMGNQRPRRGNASLMDPFLQILLPRFQGFPPLLLRDGVHGSSDRLLQPLAASREGRWGEALGWQRSSRHVLPWVHLGSLLGAFHVGCRAGPKFGAEIFWSLGGKSAPKPYILTRIGAPAQVVYGEADFGGHEPLRPS